MNKIISFVVQLVLLTFLIFGLHYILQQVLGVLDNWNDTGYSLFLIYIFELMLSILVVVIIVGTSKKLAELTGYIFLALISLKCIASYVFIKPVLDAEIQNDFIKHNFLIVFLIFLVFDVYVTYRVLNQENTK
jgi:hypothetical protein